MSSYQLMSGISDSNLEQIQNLKEYIKQLKGDFKLKKIVNNEEDYFKFIRHPLVIENQYPSYRVDDIAFFVKDQCIVGHAIIRITKETSIDHITYGYFIYEYQNQDEVDFRSYIKDYVLDRINQTKVNCITKEQLEEFVVSK